MQSTARAGRGGTYAYHAPADDHEQTFVSVRFHYATVRRATTTRQMRMFDSDESCGVRAGEAAFIVAKGLGELV